MIIQKFTKGPVGNNNYVVMDENSGEAAIIDCTQNPQDMMDFIQQKGGHLKYVLLTHGHFDHVMGLNKTADLENVYLSKDDKELLENINDFMDLLNLPHTSVPKVDVFFENDTALNLGDHKIQIISTPGHTEGSVCFLIQNYLFSGDTIFKQSHGRTDFPGGSAKKIYFSLKNLLSLPEDTIVLPGHGPETTIKEERQFYRK